MPEAMNAMKDPRTIWDARYAPHNESTIKTTNDPWLERWHGLIGTAKEKKILDLGCGSGRDCRYLTGLGHKVIAVDFSQQALRICHQMVPKAKHCQIDIRDPLPFSEDCFQIVVADLCLHYFHWQQTQEIVYEIHRCLKDDGFLFARVNSTGDVNYGAVGYSEVETNLFIVRSELKRFFDEESIERLFQRGWIVHGVEEMTVDRYAKPKVLWEIVLEKTAR
jgi:SAM-dependent methyltransferase